MYKLIASRMYLSLITSPLKLRNFSFINRDSFAIFVRWLSFSKLRVGNLNKHVG